MPNDGETETQPSVTSRRQRVGLTKAIEHERQHVWSNAHTGIGNLNLGPTVRAPQSDGNHIVDPRELERVREDVPEHLL